MADICCFDLFAEIEELSCAGNGKVTPVNSLDSVDSNVPSVCVPDSLVPQMLFGDPLLSFSYIDTQDMSEPQHSPSRLSGHLPETLIQVSLPAGQPPAQGAAPAASLPVTPPQSPSLHATTTSQAPEVDSELLVASSHLCKAPTLSTPFFSDTELPAALLSSSAGHREFPVIRAPSHSDSELPTAPSGPCKAPSTSNTELSAAPSNPSAHLSEAPTLRASSPKGPVRVVVRTNKMVAPITLEKSNRYLVRIPRTSSPPPTSTAPTCTLTPRDGDKREPTVTSKTAMQASIRTSSTPFQSLQRTQSLEDVELNGDASNTPLQSQQRRLSTEDIQASTDTSNTTFQSLQKHPSEDSQIPTGTTSTPFQSVQRRQPLEEVQTPADTNTSSRFLRRRQRLEDIQASSEPNSTPFRAIRRRRSSEDSHTSTDTTGIPFRSLRKREPSEDMKLCSGAKRKAYEMEPQKDPVMERCRLNAINARRNRELKKAQMMELERQVETVSKERDQLAGENKSLREAKARLEQQVAHLNNILRNQSELSVILGKLASAGGSRSSRQVGRVHP